VKLGLARIDDRMIHGQVVVGCCGPLHARRLLLCNDEVAADPLQRRIYAAAVPPEVEVEILDRPSTVRRLQDLDAAGQAASAVLVVANPGDMLWLVRSGCALAEVNVGGLHFRRDRPEELWPGVFVGEVDRSALRDLLALGIRLWVQSVPGAACVDAGPALVASSQGPTP
jgi:mannose/fructose/N-acetylgalactosamine-specific phosphotransferase system component IIB